MTFDEVLAQVLEILQHQGRVSYGALKRRFDLDDAYLDDLDAADMLTRLHQNQWQPYQSGGPWFIANGACIKGQKAASRHRRLDRGHVVVGEAEMMPDLVDQHIGPTRELHQVVRRLRVSG